MASAAWRCVRRARPHFPADLLADARRTQRLVDPPPAIAAPQQAAAFAAREGGVVDIARPTNRATSVAPAGSLSPAQPRSRSLRRR